SAGSFGALSVFGMVTKRDLSPVGKFMFFGLIGVIIASIVNWFVQSSALYAIINYAGVLVFAGLTAYDTQKLKQIYDARGEGGNLALRGALTLYLDFINLFIFLLRILGRRR
ncbi:MAG: Bax inhibitor-1/YccA family protein, partial [Myxococcota bacterium]